LSEAKLYLAEIGLALEYLHGIGVVYRDLKTENVLLAADGHLKLTDFGLARDVNESDVTSSFCGTNEYLAPEVVMRQPYTIMVDWWAFGILAFELLFACTPFGGGGNNARMFKEIAHKEVAFPPDTDPKVSDFIGRFLDKRPKSRAKFADMKNHAFWEGLNFDDVLMKKVQPSFEPAVVMERPTNFDPEFTEEPAFDSLPAPVCDENLDFQGFSYVHVPDPVVSSV
jgi:serine/threonine protein kinase